MLARLVLVGLVASCAPRARHPIAARPHVQLRGAIAGRVTADAPVGFFLDAGLPPDRVPLEGVEVIATSRVASQPLRTVSDEQGRYSLSGPAGTYRVTFRHPSGATLWDDGVEIRPSVTTPVFVNLRLPEPLAPVCVYFETCWI